jgi:hypothetical protein
MRCTRQPVLFVLAVYLLLAVVLTFPLIAHFDTHVPGHGVDDPAQTWSLWWVMFATFNLGASPLFTDYLFYPLGINLVTYTPTFLNGVLSAPLQYVFGVIVAQNLVVYFALIAGGYGTFLLAREISSRNGIQSDVGAALAGAFYAFGAWHLNYAVAGHFMLLSNEWIPFFALYLIRSDKQPWRNGALAALFFVMTAWTELTFVPFIALLTALYVIRIVNGRVGEWVRGRLSSPSPARPLSPSSNSMLCNLAMLAFVFTLGISPLVLNLLNDTLRYGYYLAPGLGRVQVFSAEPISFFVPSAQHPVLGQWANSITNANTSYAFIGYAALILAALGFVFHRTSPDVRFWAVLAMCFALLMLGPTLVVGTQNTNLPLPFAALRAIPFVNANRYPVRFNVMLILALAPLIALGVARLVRARRGTIALLTLTALLVFEQLVLPIPLTDLRVPAIARTIRDEPGDFALLDLPLGWRGSVALQGKLDDKAQFYQTTHHKRLLGGITSRTPQFKFQYFLELPVINSLIALETERDIDEVRLAQDRAAAPEVLRFFNIRYVHVTRALTEPQVLQYALDVFPLTEVYRDDARIVYRVADLPAPRAINLADETARLYFDDGWGRAQFSPAGFHYRWATRGDAVIWLPLEHVEQTITFRLRGVRMGQVGMLRVNGQPLAKLALTAVWDDYAVRLPASAVRDGVNEFVFETETAPISITWQDNYAIGDTGFVSPVDIAATGAGFDAGRFGEIFVAGRNVIENRRGYHLVAINPQNGAVDRVASFDTFADAAESARLAQFVAELPRDELVAGVAIDEVSRNLQPEAVGALRQLGVESDLRYQFRAGHAFIGVKGAQPGQAVERVDGRFPANVAVVKNVAGDRIAFALAGIAIDR